MREGPRWLKVQSHPQNQMKNLKGNPGWWQFWSSGVYGGWRSWLLLGFSELRTLCCVVGGVGVRPTLVCRVVTVAPAWEVVNVGWSAPMPVGFMVQRVSGASIDWKAVWAAAEVGRGAWGVPSKTAASDTVGMGVGLWSAEMYPMSGAIIGVWPVPLVVAVLMPWMRSAWWHGIPDGGILWGQFWSLMTSARVWGSFSYVLYIIVGASLRPLMQM